MLVKEAVEILLSCPQDQELKIIKEAYQPAIAIDIIFDSFDGEVLIHDIEVAHEIKFDLDNNSY